MNPGMPAAQIERTHRAFADCARLLLHPNQIPPCPCNERSERSIIKQYYYMYKNTANANCTSCFPTENAANFGVEINDLEQYFGRFDRVFAVFSSGCRGPTPPFTRRSVLQELAPQEFLIPGVRREAHALRRSSACSGPVPPYCERRALDA